MGKRIRRVYQNKARQKPAIFGKGTEPASPFQEDGWWEQCEPFLEFFPEGVIACDRDSKIQLINAEARKIFEIDSHEEWHNAEFERFFQFYTISDEQLRPMHIQPWLQSLFEEQPAAHSYSYPTYGYPIFFRTPSGTRYASILYCSALLDRRREVIGIIAVFHQIQSRYQKALHLQRVYEAIVSITEALEHMPDIASHPLPEESILLSPPVLFVAQQVAEVIHNILDCQRVALLAFRLPTDLIYYVAGSGLTSEQEQYLRERGGRLQLSEFLDETKIMHLGANQEVLLTSDQLYRSLIFPSDTPVENLLLVPLFVEQRMVGMIQIVKARLNDEYTPEEIELVKVVAGHTMLVIECICILKERSEAQTKEFILNEIKQLTTDFLTIAAHELRTPLTGILGNIQLAQRRVESLKRQMPGCPEALVPHFTRVQQPLEAAAQSARVQQRMINDLVDDARIQSNQLTLMLKPCDLKKIVTHTVEMLRQDAPDRAISLITETVEQPIIVRADSERIAQTLTIYVENALRATNIAQPISVRVTVEEMTTHVYVHSQGQSLNADEQAHLWDRFYRSKEGAIQHELDLSLGLGFYLCREFMKRQEGDVGVISDPSHGTTFWFCLPLLLLPKK
ncbi:ATP-binding protein [Dictyobacter aurantiacus]|uniref:histidine kinase n=1 Tax=Dictyobacter aurantiacus TaxID=1936993 RepID=A0A401ZMN2_9CHLR|nr:ATP-binding protein [Dictyobacter aurantiacus]GCE08026.1 hypothetical protein KDAU_53550 [Dictyobacter aurantiacus]